MSTQAGFGLIMSELASSQEAVADRIITTAPDVTVSTNLGGWVTWCKLWALNISAKPEQFRISIITMASTPTPSFMPHRPLWKVDRCDMQAPSRHEKRLN
jgi:hypothetical protein